MSPEEEDLALEPGEQPSDQPNAKPVEISVAPAPEFVSASSGVHPAHVSGDKQQTNGVGGSPFYEKPNPLWGLEPGALCNKYRFTCIEAVTWLPSDLEKGLLTISLALDFIGLLPGLGEPADLLSGGISLTLGDYDSATLSLLSAVPFAGTGTGLLKAQLKMARLGGGKKTSYVYQLIDETGKPVYIGMADSAELAFGRLMQHSREKDFKGMQIIAEFADGDDLHGMARTFEAMKIRQIADKRGVDPENFEGFVSGMLDTAGLLNRNRGRIKERWLAKDDTFLHTHEILYTPPNLDLNTETLLKGSGTGQGLSAGDVITF